LKDHRKRNSSGEPNEIEEISQPMPNYSHTRLNNALQSDIHVHPTNELERQIVTQLKAIKNLARRSFFQFYLSKITNFKQLDELHIEDLHRSSSDDEHADVMDSLFCGPDYFANRDASLERDEEPALLPLDVIDQEFYQNLFPPLTWNHVQIKVQEDRRLDLYKRAVLHCEAWLMMKRLGYLQYYEAMAHPDVPLQGLA